MEDTPPKKNSQKSMAVAVPDGGGPGKKPTLQVETRVPPPLPLQWLAQKFPPCQNQISVQLVCILHLGLVSKKRFLETALNLKG